MLPDSESQPFLDKHDNRSPGQNASDEYQHEHNFFARTQHPQKTSKWSIFSHILVFLITSFLWGSLILLTRQPKHTHAALESPQHTPGNITSNAKLLTCGNSPAQAKSMGCQYDILSKSWVPGACMDQEAVEEYKTDGSWFGFADENRTELLPTIEAMSELELYYTNERDHIVHCAMLWRKQARAFLEGWTNLDSLTVDFSHTEHCSQWLMDMSDKGEDYREVPFTTFVGYAECWVRE